jgi:predicted unusual protein kinase regulating ubiquinone biosynthesis (AarF/ABC1/UbiB family)
MQHPSHGVIGTIETKSATGLCLTLSMQGAWRRTRVVPALTSVFSKALANGVSNVSFSMLSADLGKTMYQFSLRIPPYYTLLVRTLSVLEVRHGAALLLMPGLL